MGQWFLKYTLKVYEINKTQLLKRDLDMKDQLIVKLKDPKVKNKIIEITANAYKDTWDAFNKIDRERIHDISYVSPAPHQPTNIRTPFYYAPPEEGEQSMTEREMYSPQGKELPLIDKTDNSLFALASQISDFERILTTGIQDLLLNDVLSLFEDPKIVTAEEIVEVYKTFAIPTIPTSQANLESLYDLFIEKVRYTLLGEYHSKIFNLFEAYHPVDLENIPDGTCIIFKDTEDIPIEAEERADGHLTIYREIIDLPLIFPLWEKNEIFLQAVAQRDYSRRCFSNSYVIAIELCGCMTQKTFDGIIELVSTILNTIIISYKMLNKDFISSLVLNKNAIQNNINNLSIFYSFKEYPIFINKIKAYIESFFSKPNKKDSLNRRIRNAVCLLVESDVQSNGAIQIALAIASIEALLGERGSEISIKLSMYIAALLEPDLAKRNDAETFFKELYNARSRILHGELLEDEECLSYKARHLAATVLDAVLILKDFLLKSGYVLNSPQDLLREINASRYRAGTAICNIDNYNVRSYWDKSEK